MNSIKTWLICLMLFNARSGRAAGNTTCAPSEIINILAQEKTPGTVAVVTKDDQVIHRYSYGVKDAVAGGEVNQQTLFRTGSLSKLVTAIAVLKMVDDGLIDLDAPLTRYLPWFSLQGDPDQWKKITVRQVLNHTSGMSRDIGCVFTDSDGVWVDGLSLQKCSQQQEVIYQPGTRLKYSNLGYILLGQIIGTRTSEPGATPEEKFNNYMQHVIFPALGMKSSTFLLNSSTTLNEASAHGLIQPNAIRMVLPRKADLSFHAPAWGLATNGDDLGQLLIFVYRVANGLPTQVLTLPRSQEMVANWTHDLHSRDSHALGLMRQSNGFSFRIGHDGHFPGFASYAFVDTFSRMGFGVLVNSISRDAVRKILKCLEYVPEAASNSMKISTADPTDGNGVFDFTAWPRDITVVQDWTGISLTAGTITTRLTPIPGETDTYRLGDSANYVWHIGEKVKFERAGGGNWKSLILSGSYRYRLSSP